MQALVRAGVGLRGTQGGLDHLDADGADFMEPEALLAGGEGFGGHPCAEQGEGEIERGAGAAVLEAEHLAVDLVLQGLAPRRARGMRLRGASSGGHARFFPCTSQE